MSSPIKNLYAILAVSRNGVIGKEGKLPWNIPEDLKYFKTMTEGHVLVMGRKTFESLPGLLPNRIHVVLTKNPIQYASKSKENLFFLKCLENRFDTIVSGLQAQFPGKKCFVIGGAELYNATKHLISEAYVTHIDKQIAGDTIFYPPANWKLSAQEPKQYSEKEACQYQFLTYTNTPIHANIFQRNSDDIYKNLITDVLQNGDFREDRTGTGTKSVFGRQMRFNIAESIPLLTTKFVGWKTVVKELLWFLQGKTDANLLKAQGVNIWNGNTSREFLDKRGLTHLPEGDIGAGYGFQWRHFGATYETCQADYTGKGADQVQDVLHQLRNDPMSRRIFMSAWNPDALKTMALPPCHVSAQFYVTEKNNQKYLSCHMYQRSVDTFLGLPFNIMSYATLTHIFATMTGMKPYELIISTGDTHIYKDHIDQVSEQITRENLAQPVLLLKPGIRNKTVDEITLEDFDVDGYFHHPVLTGKMAV